MGLAETRLNGPPLVLGQLLAAGLELAKKRTFHHLLYVSDLEPPADFLRDRSGIRKKLVRAVTSEAQRLAVEATGLRSLVIPAYDLTRSEKLKLALVSGIARGIFRQREQVIGLVARAATAYPDSLRIISVGARDDEARFAGLAPRLVGIEPEAVESVIELAVSIGAEGWEGMPLGALFTLGDASRVMELSDQLALNPFQGYAEAERNLLDPAVRDAVRAFATLDGAFVVRDDGVVLAAGRYLNFGERKPSIKLPLGLGARHMAAAGMSLVTDALTVVVSQTTGGVRLFRRGRVALELRPPRRRKATPPERRG